ncbi:MAG TPA: ATP-binding protein, partial [Candidatus Binatia bacterium]|nr:ATP-binding protein [Candidatus Binatia bacterium]
FLVARVRLPDGNETGTAESPTTGEEPTPPAAGELLLSASLSAAQAATGQLPAIVAALAGTTALGAFVLALWLSRVLARRLAAVHAGLLAIAEGRRPAPIPTHDEDPIDRLVEALGRLLAALERRETTIRRSFEAIAAAPVDRPPGEVATALLDAIDDIFGLRWSAIVEADGTVFARSARAPADVTAAALADAREMPSASAGFVVADLDPRPPPIPFDPLALGGERHMVDSGASVRRLVAHLSPTVGASAAWSPADEASLRLVALLVGSAIKDAERYATAAERALRLERLNQLQRQFLRSVSHNLRTPLATIGLAVDDLAEAVPVAADPELARRAQAIRTEAARLGRLVDQVLTLSRLEAGTVDLAAEPLVPAEVAAAVWQELDVDRPFRIDDGTGGRPVLADRRALEQILWILLDNAIRYAPTGAIEVRIGVQPKPDPEGRPRTAEATLATTPATTSAPAPPELEIAVLDEGPGVPPGERGRIFHRFVRGSTAGHQAGTGLGLSLARSLARLMGGDLVYVDRGGAAGACFVLRIPAGSEAAPGREGGVRRSTDRTRPAGQARAARVRAGH